VDPIALSLGTHSRHSSINSDSSDDIDRLEDMLLDRWDARTQDLVVFLLTARVLEACPPMKKSSQLDLYLTDFRRDHPDRFRKKLRVSPLVFDRLVELINDHVIFHNNSNIPQHPPAIQLAIFLVHVGHYGNASAPEYVAQWAGVCIGTVINATYRCLVAFLALHDEAIMMPPVTSPVLSWCCAPTYASPISPPSLSVPTGPLYRLYRTNFGRCRNLDA
jgi:hypothetical protein